MAMAMKRFLRRVAGVTSGMRAKWRFFVINAAAGDAHSLLLEELNNSEDNIFFYFFS